MNKAVFLDRDGVINVDKEYVHKPKDLEFIEGVHDALRLLISKGYKIFIITNQSGIGRGYYTEEDYLNLKKAMHDEFENNNINITKEYYCKHSPDDDCDCRKPGNKFIEEAIFEYDIDREKSYMIGDKTSDILAGKISKLKTILVKTGKAGKDKKYEAHPDKICKDLYDAAKTILRQGRLRKKK